MNKVFKFLAVGIISLLFAQASFAGANGQILLTASNYDPVDFATVTYANSQTDTVVWVREAGVSGISFSANWTDSVKIASDSGCRVLRVVGNFATFTSGDTLAFSAYSSTANNGVAYSVWFAQGNALVKSVTITPYTDKILFIVKYAASGNASVSNPTVQYKVNKTYSR